ncbi:MAG TPA: carboxypeptidase-like regulatory domain-containing protein [Urbifossiella sp.]|jgi:hypothetical protein|nr:carboxypeptidase-like regulatory domain-containing protein [Urbifossiella sp.]
MSRRGFAILTAAVAIAGCGGPAVPAPTPVEGVVLLNGQPLPNAQVMFTPTAPGLPAGAVASATTDDAGRFVLTTGGKTGAVPGEHLVTVAEGPVPEELRGEQDQEKAAKARAGLKNRPIPPRYGTATKSDLRVTVTKDQKEYKVELTR